MRDLNGTTVECSDSPASGKVDKNGIVWRLLPGNPVSASVFDFNSQFSKLGPEWSRPTREDVQLTNVYFPVNFWTADYEAGPVDLRFYAINGGQQGFAKNTYVNGLLTATARTVCVK